MTKIDIFSGFLGAGKTTLIRKLIKEAFAGEKLVLIENEFGEIGVDGAFMQDAGIEVTEMNSGCICCSLVGDFGKALKKVLETYAPDRILIEPSGVGKLSDVIKAVEKVDSRDLILNSFTTVVDAKKAKIYMKNFGEFFNNQVENANSIILSRTAGMDPAKLSAAIALLREKNPEATLITTPWEELDGKTILAAMEKGVRWKRPFGNWSRKPRPTRSTITAATITITKKRNAAIPTAPATIIMTMRKRNAMTRIVPAIIITTITAMMPMKYS